jgi:multicomponent Na+:H+ antiporter subunit G
MMTILMAVFFLAGCLFLLLAGLGSWKFPDLFMRMAAVSKASTLGLVLCAVGTALHFRDPAASIKVVVLVVFLFLSAPIAAHLLGRVAFRNGAPIFHRTRKHEDSHRI